MAKASSSGWKSGIFLWIFFVKFNGETFNEILRVLQTGSRKLSMELDCFNNLPSSNRMSNLLHLFGCEFTHKGSAINYAATLLLIRLC